MSEPKIKFACPECGKIMRYSEVLYLFVCEKCNVCYKPTLEKLGAFKNNKEVINAWCTEYEADPSKYPFPTEPPPVKCPNCHSTQIQAVPRKWGLFTGVLTNAVDRVCLNCGRKF